MGPWPLREGEAEALLVASLGWRDRVGKGTGIGRE